jgi:monovalent cation:proton antiporter-2 (CPA2) family protein
LPHSATLITTLAAALGLALILGFVAVRLKLPALVGYLIAGVLIGPATPGFVADIALSQQLAEVGVILLMFGVGLQFSLDDLLAVRKIALPGALAQIVVATVLGAAVARAWGWTLGAGIVFGLALSVASTVVLLRALEDRGVLESVNGRIAVGWLLVQDLAMVLALVLLPALAAALVGAEAVVDASARTDLLVSLAVTLGRVAVFIALMLLVGRRVFPWLLWQVARTGSRELFTLCVIAAAVGIAYGSAYFFGVSFALGAFFAGMVLRESSLSFRAAEESLPLRDAFSVLFFVSVGMLFDPAVVLRLPGHLLATVAIIVFGKTIAAFAIVLLHPRGGRAVASGVAGGRPQPHSGRVTHLDRIEPVRLSSDRASAGLDTAALATCADARAFRRSVSRASSGGQSGSVHRPHSASRVRTCGTADRRSIAPEPHTVHRGRAEQGDRGEATFARCSRCFRRRFGSQCVGSGAHRPGAHVGDCHAGRILRAKDAGDRTQA